MNLPLQYETDTIIPIHLIMHGIFDDVLSLTTGLCESKMSFILFWDEEYHVSHHHAHGTKTFQSTDFLAYKERFSGITAPCFYAPNSKYHTLFQDLYFFKLHEKYNKVLVYPIKDQDNETCGLIGVMHPENPASIDANKHILKGLSKHASKLRNDKVLEKIKFQPKPTFLQSLNQIPGAHFEFIVSPDAKLGRTIASDDLIQLHPHFQQIQDLKCPLTIFRVLHQIDFEDFYNIISEKQDNNSIEFSYSLRDETGTISYYMVKINSFRNNSAELLCFGMVQNISIRKCYEEVLEQIVFDISHVMRRPVATMQGLTQLIELDKMNGETVKEVAHKLQLVSNEMDTFIKRLYVNYQKRWEDLEIQTSKI
jgi:hypothetical protein